MRILWIIVQIPRNEKKNVNGLSPSNGRTNLNEPTNCWKITSANFVNYDQSDWYQLLPLAEYAYNNSKARADKLTPFFANYGFHTRTEWMKDRDVQNPGATIYTPWMQTVQNKARKTSEQTQETMKKYYNQRARPQPDIDIGDLVMLNAKNIRTKRPTKKLSLRL